MECVSSKFTINLEVYKDQPEDVNLQLIDQDLINNLEGIVTIIHSDRVVFEGEGLLVAELGLFFYKLLELHSSEQKKIFKYDSLDFEESIFLISFQESIVLIDSPWLKGTLKVQESNFITAIKDYLNSLEGELCGFYHFCEKQ